jgi:hypothetical protein
MGSEFGTSAKPPPLNGEKGTAEATFTGVAMCKGAVGTPGTPMASSCAKKSADQTIIYKLQQCITQAKGHYGG